MGLLQSLGLAGASKAVRRLLRRSSPSSPSATASPPLESRNAHIKATQPSDHAGRDFSPPVESAQSPANNATPNPSIEDGNNMLSQKASTLATQSRGSRTSAKEQQKDELVLVQPNVKENQPTSANGLADGLAGIGLEDTDVSQNMQEKTIPSIYESDDPAIKDEKVRHQRFTEEALDMARLALRTNETPVGCVLVHGDTVIAKGMNATNVTRNGTRHAEFMALTALLSYPPKDGPRTTRLLSAATKNMPATRSESGSISSVESDKTDGNDDGSKGHLYPYGQKLHPDPIVDQAILRECVLYVTVEPCVMCASLLRQFGIKKVYFGAVNDKFGGTGGVFSIHANSDPDASSGIPKLMSRQPPPLVGAAGTLGESFPAGGGDGGNVERGYEIEGGWGRDEAVGLLRRFYVQENGRAPVPRKKEGRAARLAAMMDRDGPDAVCAALLCADGMLDLEKVPTQGPAGEQEAIGDCGDLNNLNSANITEHAAMATFEAESDKENTSVPS